MFYLHARRALANVSSDYKHLTPNYTISFQNLLIRDGPLENLWRGRAKYKKIIRARES